MLFGAVLWMHAVTPFVFFIGLAMVLYTMFAWWSEVVAESRIGDHTPVVRIGLRYGFILFVMSEVMFFFAWFWSFFKHAMYPMENYFGSEYARPEIFPVDPFHLPLINTLVLLLSGCAVTWAHHALVHNNDRKALIQGWRSRSCWAWPLPGCRPMNMATCCIRAGSSAAMSSTRTSSWPPASTASTSSSGRSSSSSA